MKKLLIVGAGGFGREVEIWATDVASIRADWHLIGFLDDNSNALVGKRSRLRVLGSVSDFVPTDDTLLVIAVGSPAIRRELHLELSARGARFANVIHPTAVVARNAELGTGIVLAPYSVVSSDTRLGDSVVLNFHALVQHDAVLGSWSQLNSHADVGGFAILGEEVLVGTHGVIPGGSHVPHRACIPPGGVFSAGR